MRPIPLLFVLCIVPVLHRVNVGIAALQMDEVRGFSDVAYGRRVSVFSVGYFLLEASRNLGTKGAEARARGVGRGRGGGAAVISRHG